MCRKWVENELKWPKEASGMKKSENVERSWRAANFSQNEPGDCQDSRTELSRATSNSSASSHNEPGDPQGSADSAIEEN